MASAAIAIPHASSVMGVKPPSSVANLLATLEEDEPALQVAALQRLLDVVDVHWVEAAEAVADIEAFSEDDEFPDQALAAAVAAKCFYHMGDFSAAQRLALRSGRYFDVGNKTEYVETILGQCLDAYIAVQRWNAEHEDEQKEIDERLVAIVQRLFERCLDDGSYTQAIGIAIEARRLDLVGAVIEQAQGIMGNEEQVASLLRFVFRAADEHIANRAYRNQVLGKVEELYRGLPSVDHLALCRVLAALEQPAAAAEVMTGLLRSEAVDDHLLAMQIAFDLVEWDNQHFLVAVLGAMPSKASLTAGQGEEEGKQAEGDEVGEAQAEGAQAAAADGEAVDGDDNDGIDAEAAAQAEADAAGLDPAFVGRLEKTRTILTGATTLAVNMHFLFKRNQADRMVLDRLKKAQTRHNDVLHEALVTTHALTYAGTTVRDFLNDNTEWLKKAAQWSRFSAVASEGVIHRGNVTHSTTVLEHYLPRPDRVVDDPYIAGGSLYALGLIHANRGVVGDSAAVERLLQSIRESGNEIVLHGGCLGLGLAALGSGNDAAYAQMRHIMLGADAVAGEAAGIGMGLVLLGQGPNYRSEITGELAIHELMNFAADSPHEKTVRGIAMGLSFVCYRREEGAEPIIAQMCRDKDPVLRYGGMYATGMAYCGTSNNAAIRRLLHVAVSDVSDDVRRAAVTNLGFVLFKNPEEVPRLVSLLSESFNPYVRQGAAMAIGIACAGTGLKSALAILKPLVSDSETFVKQGALMATALVLQAQSEARVPDVKWLRDEIDKVVNDKYAPAMHKMGAIVARGLMDAGGRNAVVTLETATGFTRMPAVVGMALFAQFWYWFPLMHCVSLSLAPTAMVGLTGDLMIPSDFSVDCKGRPSHFAYPDKLKEEGEAKKEKVATFELSTTAKARAKAAAKKKAKEEEEGGKAAEGAAAGAGEDDDAEMAGAEEAAEATAKKAKAKEATEFQVPNPSRVTRSQRALIRFRQGERYRPVRRDASLNLGIMMLRDTRPGEADASLQPITVPEPGTTADGPEPGPPEPFDWVIE